MILLNLMYGAQRLDTTARDYFWLATFSAKILSSGTLEILRGRPSIEVFKLLFLLSRPALFSSLPFSISSPLLRKATTMETTSFDLDFLVSDRDTRDWCDSSWLALPPPLSSSLCGLCGLSPYETAGFPLQLQSFLDGSTGRDASWNSLGDISAPMTAFYSFPQFFDPLEGSWEACDLSGIPSTTLLDSWDDLISRQNYKDTETGFSLIGDLGLEGLKPASEYPTTESPDRTLLQCLNDSNIQGPSGAFSGSNGSGCADDSEAIVLTGEGSVPIKFPRPSRAMSDAGTQTDNSLARIKSTGALKNDKLTTIATIVPPARAGYPVEDTSAEDVLVKHTSSDGTTKRQRVSSGSPPVKRRKTTPPYAKGRKSNSVEHNYRISKITCGNRKYQWNRRKRVWESDSHSLEGDKMPFHEVTEVEVFPNGQSSQQVVLYCDDRGLFCGTDEVSELPYSLKRDTVLSLIIKPDEAKKAARSIV